MFQTRRNSQKPDEELYAAFKQTFPGVGPGTNSSGSNSLQRSTSLSEALTDASLPNPHGWDLEDGKEHDATPKENQEPWRFTPSVMDVNSFAFSSFANQPPGYYAPTPGGVNTLYHSQAGDLHTPGMGMTIGTPLSLPQSGSALPTANLGAPMQNYQHSLLHAHRFDDSPHYASPPQTYAPSSFLHHQDSGYGAPSQSPHQSPLTKTDPRMLPPDSNMSLPSNVDSGVATSSGRYGEMFRYHTTLNAPTAMIKHSEDIPISYLNKGQAYTLSIVDSLASVQNHTPVRYRTFVRISFEDEEQRSKSAACWQLWKEGRGTNEAHQRDGKLVAVEYVDTNQGGDEESRRPQIELQQNSFDGFCVTWCANPFNGRSECAISVRFNFLSTDFSHSKGVKGIPVRLCSKTEKILPDTSSNPSEHQPEVCYAKVKLFRDHGAERKLANDVSHVKKTIEKLKQSIAQAESGIPTFGKRKRSNSGSKALGKGPGKVVKHKRTWSMDSDGEGAAQGTPEEDLVMKLTTTQDMFSSTRPVSVLYLRGEPEDDPDICPVQLSSDLQDLNPAIQTETWESKPSAASTPVTSTAISPTSSSNVIVSPHMAPSAFQSTASNDYSKRRSVDTQFSRSSIAQSTPQQAAQQLTGYSGKSIDVVDVDTAYQPPPERSIKPVACFYVRHRESKEPYHRAIYLMQRTVNDLVHAISHKFQVEASSILRVTHINPKGLQIVVDEDVVRELDEGQDMIVEFSNLSADYHIKSEMEGKMDPHGMLDSDVGHLPALEADGLEMWLNF